MIHFTARSFLLAFAAVVVVSGALGSWMRRLSSGERKARDPMTIFVERTRWRLHGTVATLVGLAVALAMVPLASALGMPTHLPGLTSSQTFLAVVVGVGLLVVVASRSWRD